MTAASWEGPPPPARSDREDGVLWFVSTALLLVLTPIGFVSGDGLAHSAAYASGTWYLNPNHLLLEPIGAGWQELTVRLGIDRSAPDRLKLLSVLAGAVAVGLFRWGIAGPIASRRWLANHGTAWFALGSAFSRLWISEEIHMLQMPALVAIGVAVAAYLRRPSAMRALTAGAWAGLASLIFVSNLVLAASVALALGIWHVRRGEAAAGVRATLSLGAASALVTFGGLGAAWAVAGPEQVGFTEWITSYGGGQVPERVPGAYGARWSLWAMSVAGARALYGAGSAIVDLAPLVEVARDRVPVTPILLLNALAFAAGAALLGLALLSALRHRSEPGRRLALLLTGGFAAGVLLFGVLWDTSDDQFYFQLALPAGVLAASLRPPRRRHVVVAVSLSALALGWNVGESTARRVLYPRAERIAALEQTVADAGLVVYPGHDEVDHLFYFVERPSAPRRTAITSLASHHSPAVGLALLQREVQDVLAMGRTVVVIDVFDVPPRRQPWKHLRNLGYERDAILEVLEAFPQGANHLPRGPFTARVLVRERS